MKGYAIQDIDGFIFRLKIIREVRDEKMLEMWENER